MKKIIILSALGIIGLASCKKEGCTDLNALNYSSEAQKDDGSCTYETPTPPSAASFVTLGTATTSLNETVTLYAESDLVVGYSNLYVDVEDDNGNTIENATLSFTPMMDMGMMQHTCPVIQPTYNSTNSRYEGVSIFQMSSMGGTWTIDVDVNGNAVTFDLNVSEPAAGTKPVGVYSGTDSETYIISLVQPENWVVGDNDLNIMIHYMESMMSFPAVTDFDVIFIPEMVSMGHSSTGNIDPVHVANGLYSGNVNLSMVGDWRLHLELEKNSVQIYDDAYLDILF